MDWFLTRPRPLVASHGWRHLVRSIPDHCVADRRGRVGIVDLVSQYTGITLSEAAGLWNQFKFSHVSAAKEYTGVLADAVTMEPEKAVCFLAHIDPDLRTSAPTEWKLWGEPNDQTPASPELSQIGSTPMPGDSKKRNAQQVVESVPDIDRSFARDKNRDAESKKRDAESKKRNSGSKKRKRARPEDPPSIAKRMRSENRNRVNINGATFLYRTGLTDELGHPGQELCAVNHRPGKFTLVWTVPPKCATLPDRLRDAMNVDWVDDSFDPETGLAQVKPAGGTDAHGWGREDKSSVGFYTRQYQFDSRGFTINRKSVDWWNEYENTLF